MRRKDREVTDLERIESIISRIGFLHLGLCCDDEPYVVPLHFGYSLEDGRLTLYMHGAKEGKKLELIRKNPRASAVMETDVKDISGGDIPCSYGAGFASIMCFGRVEIVEDEEEKIKGLRLLMKHQTGRDFEITKEMAGGVSVIRLAVNELSCKVHP